MTHFNGLTPAEDERLALLAEEAAEVIQAVAKIQRHGFESFNPFRPGKLGESEPWTNRHDLAKEIGHFRHAVFRLIASGDVDGVVAHECEQEKQLSIAKWLHHQAAGS